MAILEMRAGAQRTHYPLDTAADHREQAVAGHATSLLRAVDPETLTMEDPVPFRTVLFRIAVGEMTGRAAKSDDLTRR